MEYMFVLFGVFAVIMVFLAYRQGLKDGRSLAEKKDVKPFFSYKPENGVIKQTALLGVRKVRLRRRFTLFLVLLASCRFA